MIILDSYTDENVFEQAKEYIKANQKTGDRFSSHLLQIIFCIGYQKAERIMKLLHDDGIVKINTDRTKTPVVI